MISLECPSCGASVCFRSKASIFAVCNFCRSTLVRHDINLETIGKMADLQDDLTPLQIGTKGIYGDKSFEIIGRLKVGYSQGFWNEWYVLFDGEEAGWLAEAQGFYAMCFPVSGVNIPARGDVRPGLNVDFHSQGMLQVEDIHEAACLFSEGELPVFAAKGRKSLSVDLAGKDKSMATIEYADDCVRVFAGAYKNFEEFQFTYLRQLDGWSPGLTGEHHRHPGGGTKTFQCPRCGGAVTLRNPGQSMSAACSQCNSIIDTTDENYQILSRFIRATEQFSPIISLGTRGDLFGRKWEVQGYLVRRDVASSYRWEEYLLFNPYHGYRWLTQAEGHWSFVTPIKEKPSSAWDAKGITGGPGLELAGETYSLFNMGQALVEYVLGEFYWRVSTEQVVRMSDYISPPRMLSQETNDKEVLWSLCEYIEPAVVEKAFKPESSMPARRGIAPNQPSGWTSAWKVIGQAWIVFMIILTCLEFVHLISASNRELLKSDFPFVTNGKLNDLTSPVFTAENDKKNIQIGFSVPALNNSWLYLAGELVNNQTGETYPFEKSIEFYSGYDSDGYWTEGARDGSLLISSVPAGQYYLNLDTESGGFKDSSQRNGFVVEVRRDVPTFANYFWCLAFLAVTPAVVWWNYRRDEVARWSNSDFSPYSTSYPYRSNS